jgi:hypothetical protein
VLSDDGCPLYDPCGGRSLSICWGIIAIRRNGTEDEEYVAKRDHGCPSYSIPLSVSFSDTNRFSIPSIGANGLESWMFAQGVEHVAVVCGPTHAPGLATVHLTCEATPKQLIG